MESSIFVEIFGDNPQDEVTVPSHQVAFDDLWKSLHFFDEMVDGLGVLRLQPDAGKNGKAHIDLRRVKQGHVAVYKACIFQDFYASKARGGRKPDLFRELCIRDSPVILKHAQDSPVNWVEIGHRILGSKISLRVGDYAKKKRNARLFATSCHRPMGIVSRDREDAPISAHRRRRGSLLALSNVCVWGGQLPGKGQGSAIVRLSLEMDVMQNSVEHIDESNLGGQPIGFIGLGVMGNPMALNLLRAGRELFVWNRSPDGSNALREAGAEVTATVPELFAKTHVVICMLANEDALDSVLGRGTGAFEAMVKDRTIVSMGSNPPDYSQQLAADIQMAGGAYVEAPVSGSRKPAEAGELVCLLSGNPDDVEAVRPYLVPMCKEIINCGRIGNASLLKLAVNHYLCTMLAGLAEAVHFAERNGLDLRLFEEAIAVGPMSSDLARIKISKLVNHDFSIQAAMVDAYNSTSLVADVARAKAIASPLLDQTRQLYGESLSLGNDRLDMISVIDAIRARTKVLRGAMQAT